MRDSSGNTQFDVLPYVKFYLKKQFLKNKELTIKLIQTIEYTVSIIKITF